MNVPNIAQGLGSVTALPRAAGDGDTAEPRAVSGAGGRSAYESPRIGADFARLAWFDANGDGHIDPRSAAAGGDATLLVPHATDLPVYSRNVSKSATTRSIRDTPDTPANAAQTNRAVDAYQRYGQASAPTAPPAPAVHIAAPAAPRVVAVATPARAVA